MSHLPLDARAILHYLNELGYRNISATQLKEFLKGKKIIIIMIYEKQNSYTNFFFVAKQKEHLFIMLMYIFVIGLLTAYACEREE